MKLFSTILLALAVTTEAFAPFGKLLDCMKKENLISVLSVVTDGINNPYNHGQVPSWLHTYLVEYVIDF